MTSPLTRDNTVLVTGGAGFIGSELVTQLAAAGHCVLVLDNLANGKRANLAHLLRPPRPGDAPVELVELVEGDVRDSALVTRLAREVHTVFHLACLGVRHALHAPIENHEVNATGTLTLLRAVQAAGVRRVVHVSSSEVYGSAESVPMDEQHPCQPSTVYGASKLAGEAYARAFHRTHGLAVTIVRPFNAYGPRCHHEGDAGEVIPKFILRALAGEPLIVFGDGRQTRDFTHVSDTARGIALAALSQRAIGRTLNLGSGSEMSIAKLAQCVATLVRGTALPAGGSPPSAAVQHQPPRPGDVQRLCADASLARELLGFKPAVALADGLAQLIQWYRAQALAPAQLLQAEVARAWEACKVTTTQVTPVKAVAPQGLIRAPIPVARPLLDDREADAVRRVIHSGWVTQGPEVEAFEREFAQAVGAPHAVAVSSGTTALHCALLAVGVLAGDDVVTVSHSFIATANAIRHCGARPVFVDIDPNTCNIDPSRVEAAITPRTRAILAVHQVGMPCDLAALLPIARRHALVLIEDAACAIGSEILWGGEWQRIGRPHGDMACFSFHPRKVLTTGDGGMVTTANAAWAARMGRLRSHGMNLSAHARHTSAAVLVEGYDELGYNYRMTDIQAAIGREQLRRLTGIVAARRALAARYHAALAGHPRLRLPAEPAWARSNWQSYVLRLDPSLERRAVMQRLLDRGIATRPGVMCAHREAAYPPATWGCACAGTGCGCQGECLAHSVAAQDHGLVIPLSPQMNAADQTRVIDELMRL